MRNNHPYLKNEEPKKFENLLLKRKLQIDKLEYENRRFLRVSELSDVQQQL